MNTPTELQPNAVATPPEKVVVAIATTGRAPILRDTIKQLATLRELPDELIICIADDADVDIDSLSDFTVPTRVLKAARGLCNQRNAIVASVTDAAIVLFIDDDFLLAEGYIQTVRRVFHEQADVVMTTGEVIADGILGPGLDHATGENVLKKSGDGNGIEVITETYNGYGCNMAVRVSVVRAQNILFDTNLPSYGWLEDVDFSRQLARHGRIVKHSKMRGVHLGTKTGRSRGVPLGYSQIANPLYMSRKGTLSPRKALNSVLRNIAANMAKMLWPEPWVDRRGRFKGNMLALGDLLRGRISPTRISEL
jgi:hypothetical protein